ncbi:MAG: ankyrin repeat domain-containing protein [Akkermansia sp.]|nr:ankyrin repeat domain-containing protein [Akkermansia sp.]
MKTAILSIIAMSGICLGANEIDIPTKGDFYAGDFSFSFTIKEGAFGQQNKEALLATYYGDFRTDMLYSNGFVLRYNPATKTATLTAGRGSLNNAGTPQEPHITEKTHYTFQPHNHVNFNTKLALGNTYTISNKGENGKQTITLSGANGRLEKHSYNGNMNGGNRATHITSLFNNKYALPTIQATTTKHFSRNDFGNYHGFIFCLKDAKKNGRISTDGKSSQKGSELKLQSLTLLMGNGKASDTPMTALLVHQKSQKVVAVSNQVQTSPLTETRLSFAGAPIKEDDKYFVYFTAKSPDELKKYTGKAMPPNIVSHFRFSARHVCAQSEANDANAKTWGWVDAEGRLVPRCNIWGPVATMQIATLDPSTQGTSKVATSHKRQKDSLSDAGCLWAIAAGIGLAGALALLGVGSAKQYMRRKQQQAAGLAPTWDKGILLRWGASGSAMLLLGLVCGVFYLQSPVRQLEKAGYNNLLAQVGLYHSARTGDADVLDNLIRAGVRLKTVDLKGLTALHHAVLNSHADCTQLLLAATDWSKAGWTPLHLAVVGNDTAQTKQLLNQGAQAAEHDPAGYTPLHLAAALGHDECLQLLLESQTAQPNATDPQGNTALHIAALNNQGGSTAILLNHPATQIEQRNDDSRTALYLAAEKGCPDAVRSFIQAGKCPINEPCHENNGTLLHLAVDKAHPATLAELAKDSKVNINKANNQGYTALALAVEQGRTQCVKTLLAVPGIEVNPSHPSQRAPISVACQENHEDCLALLLQHPSANVSHPESWNGTTSLRAGIRQKKNPNILKMLLQHHTCDVNKADNDGVTPLHEAAKLNNHIAVKQLLAIDGINKECKTKQGDTPVDCALNARAIKSLVPLIQAGCELTPQQSIPLWRLMEYGEKESIELLIKHHLVDVCTPIKTSYMIDEKQIPIMYAIYNEYDDITKLMIEAAGDKVATMRDNDDNTLLHAAALAGKPEIVQLLLEKKLFDINGTNKCGATALRCAVTANSPETVQLLLEQAGINVNQGNADGNTALHKAAARGYGKCIDLLLAAKGINIHAKNNLGETPMYWAIRELHSDCYHKLKQAGAKPTGPHLKLAEATMCNQHNKVRELIGEGKDTHAASLIRTMVQHAAAKGEADMLAALLTSKHAELNDLYEGMPLLYHAARNGHANCVRVLLSKAGIDPNNTCMKWPRYSPLAVAINRGYNDCAKAIVAHPKTKINQETRYHSAIAEAYRTRNLELLKIMFNKWKSAQDIDRVARYAIEVKLPKMFKLALKHPSFKADAPAELINLAIYNGSGECLSMMLADKRFDASHLSEALNAIVHQDVKKIRQLAWDGEDFCAEDEQFKSSPLLLAVQLNLHKSVLALLSLPGIDANHAEEAPGKTLLHHAADGGNVEMVKLLLKLPAVDVSARTSRGRDALFFAKCVESYDAPELKKRKAACARILKAAQR